MQSIVGNHALVDGDERLGWLATAVLLEINGASVAHVGDDDVLELVTEVAASGPDPEHITARLEEFARR